MAADVVGRDALVALRVMIGELGRPPSAAHAALGIDDDVVALNESSLQQRRQGENRRGRIAAGVGHERGRRDLGSIQLRQTVYDLAQALGVGVLLAVPLGEDFGIVEAIVGAEVDDPRAGGQQVRNHGAAGAVRQAAKGTLRPRGDLRRREVFQSQVQSIGERRMDHGDRRLTFLPAGNGDNLRPRMAEQDLDQFERRVARAPKMAMRVMVSFQREERACVKTN